MLSVWLLGDFRIKHDDRLITDVNTPRLQSLLSYLILHRDSPQSRRHVAFLFWPETSEDQARTNLRNLLHHLRQAIPNADSYLDIRTQTMQWRSDAPFILDVTTFYNAMTAADQASYTNDAAAAQVALERAVAIYKGDLLPSCYDDWILTEREALRQAYLSALERLVRLLEEHCKYPEAIQNAQRLLRHDLLHEATYRRLIRLYALNDDRASALRVYHTCATVLQRELGVEPSAPTRDAYEQLLCTESQVSPTILAKTTFTPLVGRQREWTQMLQTWQIVVAGGEPHLILLCGEAGIGKTKLAEDFLQSIVRQGINHASANCYLAGGEMTYAPVTAWLRANPLPPMENVWLTEVARLLPEILVQRPDLPKPVVMTEVWQRQHFEEALAHAILGLKQPLLLIVDDLQWCDKDTLEWLNFLLRFDCKARLLVVGTYRPEEIGENHPLLSTLQALRHEEQVTEIELEPLDEVSTHNLAMLIAGTEISLESAHHLFLETEGNPLFVTETVRAGLPVRDLKLSDRKTQMISSESLPRGVNLPPKIRWVLESRLAQVSRPSRKLADLAATIGREFSFDLLEAASDQGENILVRELDELWQRRIVREHGADGYDFSHDKLREVIYSSMSSARRRLLHRHVAQGLKTLHTADLDAVSYQLASHYERAGLPDQAIPFYLRAARVARQVYANEEALALLQRGIALAEEFKKGMSEDEYNTHLFAPLWEEMGDILAMKALHEEALQAYQTAQTWVPRIDAILQARLYRKVGTVRQEQRQYVEALDGYNQAETLLGEQPLENNSRWWDEWLEVQVEKVWVYYWLAQWPQMDALVNKLQPVVKLQGKVSSRMRFLMASCLMNLRKKRYTVSDEMLADSFEALSLSHEWGDVRTKTDCYFELAFLHLWRRELDKAEENLLAALKLAEASGIMSQQTLIFTYMTVLHRFRGDIDGVMKYALQAQEVAEAAHMPDYVAAAMGNQAWLAWRNQDLTAAEQKSQEALGIWEKSPLVYPFKWQALWPLVAVSLVRGREDQAWAYARVLLEPTQQLLPDILNTSLEAALQAKEADQAEVAQSCLNQTMELAREMGYL
jgi:DNA-binding SARP family transcriptional activator